MRGVALVGILLLGHIAAATGREQCGVAEGKLRARRIINGDGVRMHQYPWVVSIQIEGSHLCGGAVLNKDYVLSAAHCFVNPDFHHATVVAGLHDLSSEGVRVRGKVTVHPGYIDGVESTRVNDLALIRLQRPLMFDDRIQPICLPAAEDSLQIGEEAIIAGWGRELTMFDLATHISENRSLSAAAKRHMLKVSNGNVPAGQSLKQIKFVIEDADKCRLEAEQYTVKVIESCQKGELNALWCSLNRHHHRNSSITETTQEDGSERAHTGLVCTISLDRNGRRSSVCYGDSGGPLMRQLSDGSWSLVGVTSSIPSDCIMEIQSLPQIGGMFVDVRHRLDWIHSIMAGGNPSAINDDIPPAPIPAANADDFVNSRGSIKEPSSPRSSSMGVAYSVLVSWNFLEILDGAAVRLNIKLSGQ